MRMNLNTLDTKVACAGVAQDLDPAESVAWLGFLRTYALLVRQLDADLVAEHALSLSSFEVLSRLALAPDGRLRMTELAHTVFLSPSGLTRLVDRLASEGLIERHHCEHDGRGLYAAISRKGRDKLEAARASHLAQLRSRFLGRFDEAELRQFGAFWNRVAPGGCI